MSNEGAPLGGGDQGWWVRVERAPRWARWCALAAAAACVLVLNALSGATLAFGGLYALIVIAVAWLLGFRAALLLGAFVLSGAALLNADAMGEDGIDVWIALALRGGALLGGSLIVARVRDRYDRAQDSADRDPLTGVANHRAFREAVAAARGRVRRRGGVVALAYIDLDDFKGLNDRDGHAAGDAMLRAVAGAATRAVRSGDRIGRLGGDEFALLVEAADIGEAEAAIARIHAALGRTMPVSFSMGAVIAGAQAAHLDPIAEADRLMYRSKRTAKGSLTVARLGEDEARLAA